jgi:ribosomal protein L20A (L18A)
MFKYYNVFLVNEKGETTKYIDTVKCISEKSAEEQCYMNFGSASKYSGWGRHNFKAVQA